MTGTGEDAGTSQPPAISGSEAGACHAGLWGGGGSLWGGWCLLAGKCAVRLVLLCPTERV